MLPGGKMRSVIEPDSYCLRDSHMNQGRPPAVGFSLALAVMWFIEPIISLQAADSAADVDYLKQVKPLLTAKCVACHGGLRQKGKLRLDTAKYIAQGGESGLAIVVGDSHKSTLIEAVLGEGGPHENATRRRAAQAGAG